jgi:NADPH2:quinone reductase
MTGSTDTVGGTAMQAVVIVASDRGNHLELQSVPTPSLGPTDVLIGVRAASLNRADLGARKALRAGATPPIAGLDAAGEVVAVGADVQTVAIGERVMARVAGGYAEFAAVDERLTLPIPPEMSFEAAAATILAAITEHDALINAGQMQAGELVLIHAAASGVGLFAVQLARLLGAERIFATVRSPRAAALLHELGVDTLIVTGESDFAQVVQEQTDGHGVDVIIDHVGGPYLSKSLASLAIRGRLVNVGRLGGPSGTLDMEALAFKRATVVGTTNRTRSLDEHIAIINGVRRDVLPLLADGRLRPIIDRTIPLADAMAGQDALAADEPIGKIVVTVR